MEVRAVREPAATTVLSRTAEDADSRVPGRTWSGLTPRPIWRHDALVDGLAPGERRQYRAVIDAVTSDLVNAADTVTAFSLLDTGAGVVRSYRFDTVDPDATLVLFDEFALA